MLESGPLPPEIKPFSGPRIIDNIGIRRGSETIDVYGNTSRIKQFLLDITFKTDEKLLPLAEQQADKLRISLGARRYSSIAAEITEKRLRREGKSPARIEIGKLIEIIEKEMFSFGNTNLAGAYFYDEEEPVLYLNFGNPAITLQQQPRILTHEASHFVQFLSGVPEGDIPKDILKFFASFIAIDTALGFGMSTAVLATQIANKKHSPVSRRDFVRLVGLKTPEMMVYTTFPALLLQDFIIHELFAPIETEAFKKTKLFVPSDEEYAQMFQVVPRLK